MLKYLAFTLSGLLSFNLPLSAAEKCREVWKSPANPYVLSSEASITTKGKVYPCKIESYYFAESGFIVRCSNGYKVIPFAGGYREPEYGLVSYGGRSYKMSNYMSRDSNDYETIECKDGYSFRKMTIVLTQESFDVLLRMKFKIATF
jgi:hypothetical protein